MTEVVVRADRARVDHGSITEGDFRDLMLTNSVRFLGEVNPDFFKGTSVEKQAPEVLAQVPTHAQISPAADWSSSRSARTDGMTSRPQRENVI